MGRVDGPLVEIVPNFSEGRRADVMNAIVDALVVPGVLLLNRQADPDHNRLDCTLVGEPSAVRRSALAGAAKAIELIDMEQHHGSHPRMGAVDVIPFVPLRDVTMQECVEMARDFARELADTLHVPVYCYDLAAFLPERSSLAEVRKGEYEGLRAAVASGERLPDFGPREIGRAGAVAVGARKLLIAFNVYFTGRDEEAAKAVGRAVRESSGGLAAVRAIGFDVPERDCVTVSMNLVDWEVTGVRTAFDAVVSEAAKQGMDVMSSEIVGLVPRAALGEADVQYLGLEGFDAKRQVLEELLSTGEAIGAGSVGAFLDALASDSPTPGGGSVAALSGAAGAALVAMVARLTVGRKAFEEVDARMREVIATADAARAAFLDFADRDAEAFEMVMAAFKMPRETDEEKAERSVAVQRAFTAAADVPLEIARHAVALMDSAREAVETGNPNAASDGASGAQLLACATECALYNVEINVASLKDAAAVRRYSEEVASLRAKAAELRAWTETRFHDRLRG